MANKEQRTRIAALAVILLSIVACNLPGQDTPEPTPTDYAPTGTATPSPEPEPSATPTEDACVPNAAFVTDVTIPDGTTLAPSASFIKTWRVENSGSCAWEPGTVLAFVSGDQMGGPASLTAGAVAVGADTDLSVELVAPSAPGSYQGRWRLESSDGPFGPTLLVSIVVGTPTSTSTPACVAPDSALASILTIAQDAGHNPGCPIGPAFTVDGAIQLFETNPENANPHARMRGFMIWRSDEAVIYALGSGWASYMPSHDGDVLHVYEDDWAEGMPAIHPDCASMSVPTGYVLPQRGFGRAWCVHSLGDSTEVGWPTHPETGVILQVQPTRNGALIRVMAHPWGITWYFSLDILGGRWYSISTTP
jgi:hypothetical protein